MIDGATRGLAEALLNVSVALRIAAKVEPFKSRDALGVEFGDSQHRIRTRVLLLGFELGVFQWLRNDAVFS